jgi:hypothetical protein
VTALANPHHNRVFGGSIAAGWRAMQAFLVLQQ